MARFKKYSHSYSCDAFKAFKQHIPIYKRLKTNWRQFLLTNLQEGLIPNEPGHLQFFFDQWMISNNPTTLRISKETRLAGIEPAMGWPEGLPPAITITVDPNVKALDIPLPTIFVGTNMGGPGKKITDIAQSVMQREGYWFPVKESDSRLIFVNYHDAYEGIVTGSRVHHALTERHIVALSISKTAEQYKQAMQDFGIPLEIQQTKTLETLYLVHSLVVAALQQAQLAPLSAPSSLITKIADKTVRFRELTLGRAQSNQSHPPQMTEKLTRL